jgi:hypothetical protein
MFPEQRSVGRICTAIYHFFYEELKMDYTDVQREIMTIVLSSGNYQFFKDVINLSLEEYKIKHPKAKNKSVENDELWNVPIKIELNANHQEKKPKFRRGIMELFFISTLKSKTWQTENAFLDFLDKSEAVEWWFKNGEGSVPLVSLAEDTGGK